MDSLEILDLIANKWIVKIVVMLDTIDGPMRFNELARRIPEISRRMLMMTLAILTDLEIVKREAHSRQNVTYYLLVSNQDIIDVCHKLNLWAVRQASKIRYEARIQKEAETEKARFAP